MLFQNRVKCCRTAGMYTCYRNLVLLRFLRHADDHFVGNCADEQNQQIRATNLLFQGTVFLCKNLRLTAMLLADIFILRYHSLISTDNYNTHAVTPLFSALKRCIGFIRLVLTNLSYIIPCRFIKCTLFFIRGCKNLCKKAWQAILAIKQLTLRALFLFLPI